MTQATQSSKAPVSQEPQLTPDFLQQVVQNQSSNAGQSQNTDSTKVIMFSAMGQHAMVLDAIKSGAKDFVVKPFQPERELEAVNKVLCD